MSQYKEFQGKTLDDAIREACEYYGVVREKLEIEILSDAKAGIFGLVGVKKASIRAARVKIFDTVSSLLEESGKRVSDKCCPSKEEPRNEGGQDRTGGNEGEGQVISRTKGLSGEPARSGNSPAQSGEKSFPPHLDKRVPGSGSSKKENHRKDLEKRRRLRETATDSAKNDRNERSVYRERPAGKARNFPGRRDEDPVAVGVPVGHAANHMRLDNGKAGFSDLADPSMVLDSARGDLPEIDLGQCDQDLLFRTVRLVILRLVEPLAGSVPCEVSISGQRVRASLDCGDVSGLLVGRDGQTLAAIQYIAARIISRQMGASVRLQIDVGKYRERQDDKLRDLALSLAARAIETGRTQTTRPLSAYQRRIVHLTLESNDAVQTRSKGEGAQRRVVIFLKLAGTETFGPQSSFLTDGANALADLEHSAGACHFPVDLDHAPKKTGDEAVCSISDSARTDSASHPSAKEL